MYLASRAEVPVTWCFQVEGACADSYSAPLHGGVLKAGKGTVKASQPFLPNTQHLSFHVPEAIRTRHAQGPARFFSFDSSKCIKTKGASNIQEGLSFKFLPTAPDTTAHCAISSPWSCLTPLPHRELQPAAHPA